MSVANRVEEVAAVVMAVTAMEATANATAEMDEDITQKQKKQTQEEAEIGGGADGRQTWDQSRMFDPEKKWHISKFDSYKFQNLEGKRARYYMV